MSGLREARAWLFLAAGLVLAVLTGVALYGVAQQSASRPDAPADTNTIQVLVAKTDIAARTVLSADLVARRDFPADLVPAGAITSDAAAVGQTTLVPIARGQAIVAGQFSSAEGQHGASLTLEAGKVLVAFPTSDPLTANGLVNVGDKVDILATVAAGTGDTAKATQTTLQNLEVLDIIGPTKDQPQRATALVFAVDHQVAIVLKYLRDSQATIDLAIRSRAETQVVKTTSVDLGYLTSTYGIKR
ncbi:MAG TPA: Flp pilus assembly protein CpaB [Chloroflexi bacterium]|jgi:pilus assembly protein CpaB|nr:Flp pilus assembly protein CpaB [Chloroflexota bacterium]